MGKSLKNLHKPNTSQTCDTENLNPDDVKTAEAKVGKYRNLNENQLMNELMSKMNSAKDSGNFDSSELDTFYYQMSPHLSHEQRNRMRALINMLKEK